MYVFECHDSGMKMLFNLGI